MNIAHVIFSFTIGGAETMLVDIVNEQIKYNNRITIFIVNDYYNRELINQIDKRVKVHFINRIIGSRNPFPILIMNFLLIKLKPDLIHCHNSNLIKHLILFRNKTYLTVHDVSFDFHYFHYYKKIFAISKSVQNYVYEKTSLKSILIYNGINIENIEKKTDKSVDQFRVVQISRLEHKKKGQDILIKALNVIVNELNIRDISVDLIGTGNSEFYLKELVYNYNLEKYINFLGEKTRSYVYSHLKEYDLFVQPSIWEGFGLTVVEGMAAMVPVLVSNNDGPYEIIVYGKYGSSFINNDYLDLQAKIIEIKNNYEEYQKRSNSQELQEYIIRNYDIRATSMKYLNHY